MNRIHIQPRYVLKTLKCHPVREGTRQTEIRYGEQVPARVRQTELFSSEMVFYIVFDGTEDKVPERNRCRCAVDSKNVSDE